MSSIKILAGDFPKGKAQYNFGSIALNWQPGDGWVGKAISAKEIASLTMASEEQVKKAFGTIGWGAVGGLALGPIGLAAGLLAGGNKKEVTFVAEFKDGKKMLAVTDNKTYQKLMAAIF